MGRFPAYRVLGNSETVSTTEGVIDYETPSSIGLSPQYVRGLCCHLYGLAFRSGP